MLFPLWDENPSTRRPWVTFALIAINILIMGWLESLPLLDQELVIVEHGFVPQRVHQLSDPKLLVEVPVSDALPADQIPVINGQPVKAIELPADPEQIYASMFTTLFLHGGWLHVLGNMWFLWIFGNNIEDRLGHWLYLAFYLIGGLLATGCHWAYDPQSTMPLIGASGAVAAVLGGYAVTFPKAKIKTLLFVFLVDFPAWFWLLFWFVGELVSAAVVRDLGVAVWAHIGGFAIGALAMPLLCLGLPPPGTSWHKETEEQFSFTPPER